MAAPNGRAPGACDVCGVLPAPYGYQPPGGAKMLKRGIRPFRACADPDCRAVGEAKIAALAVGGLTRRALPPAVPMKDAPQGSLL